MSGSPLASLFVALGLDASAFDKGIDAAGAKATTLGKTGVSAGQVFSGGMVAIGAGLGVVTGAAMQAERAQGDFMAATGASRDEAKQFVSGMDSLAGSAGAVGKSFSDIAGAGSLIAQQMGTTGDETTKLTGQILTFAKVTKTDVSTAITGLDDAMDSWNLTADQTGNVMDVVTAGVQEFGGTAQDSLGLLNTLAPSLQAANMQWDDAAGLINLFNRAGVDASVTATAFNKVLTKVKSPEELQQLVADIAATKDPFDRAQKAAAAFGTKAGPKLALALADSGGDLTKFKIKIGDATGAVDDAGAAMLTTGDRIHGMVDKMMAGAREVGQQFGPALTGAASLASLATPLLKKMGPLGKSLGAPLAKGLATTFSTGLTSVLGSLSSNSALTGGMDTIGKALGGRLGTALKGAAALGLAGLAIEMLPGLMAEWDKIRLKLEDIGHQTSETAGKSTDEIIAAVAALHKVPDSFDPLKRGIFELSAALPFALGDAKNTWGRSLSELEGELRARGVDVDKALADYASGAAATVDSTATLTPDAIDRASEANTAALDGAATDVSASFDQYVTKWEDGSAALRIAGQQLAEFDPDTEAWSLGKDFAAASADTQAGITAWIAAQTSSIDQAGLAIYGAIERYVTKFKDGSAAIRVAGTDLAVFDPDSGLWKADDDILKASGDTADAVEVWIEKQNGVWDAASSALGTSLADVRGKITEGLSGIQDAFDLGLDTKKRKNVSGTQRLKQMADDIDKITKNLHDSIKANDPVNTAYWESALINATGKYDAARQSINVDSAAISTDLSNAGVSMKQDWLGIGKDAKRGKNKINTAATQVNVQPAVTTVGNAADSISAAFTDAGNSAKAVPAGVSDHIDETRAAAQQLANAATNPVGTVAQDLYDYGDHAGAQWIQGLKNGASNLGSVANHWAQLLENKLGFSQPPPEGPLHYLPQWGPHMVDLWASTTVKRGKQKIGGAAKVLSGLWTHALRDDIFNSLSDLEAGTNNAALGKAAQHLAEKMRHGYGHKGATDAMFEALSEFEAHGASKRQGAEAAALAKLLRKWAAPDEPDPKRRHHSADWYDTAAPIGHRHDRRDRHRPAADDRGDTGGDVYNITIHGNVYGQGGIKQLAADLDRYRTRSTRGGRRLVGAF